MPDGADTSPDCADASLRVGDWLVEPALNRLSAAAGTVRLEPKAMALLCHLARRPGQVVSREALLAAVWPGVVVGDDSLTQAVIKLRKALGDTAEAPVYIQTIAKRGYRLLAPVQPLSPAAQAEPSAPATPPASVMSPAPVTSPASAMSPASAAPPQSAATSSAPAEALRQKRHRGRRLAAVAVIAIAAAAPVAWWAGAAFRLAPSAPAVAAAEASRAAQPAVRIAPFQAIGADPQAALLAQGLTADLVTDLSKVFGLAVIADALAAHPAPEPARGEATPVQYVVTGSVQRFEDRVRLQVHLAEAATGRQLWSERYDRPVADLFALQDELVPRLLKILPAKVSEAELRRVAHHHTPNLQAYELYQRGQMALLTRQREDNEQARTLFRRAIELDPGFAVAYAALAQTYAADHRNQWTRDPRAALARAWELARTAHELNPDVRETDWVLAFVHLERGEHRLALEQLQTAVRLYPSFADAYAFMGGIHAYLGEPEQTPPLIRTAMRLNPAAGHLYYLILGRAYFGLGDLEQARIHLERALMRNPVNLETHVYAAAVHAAAGHRARAGWEAEEIRALQPGFSLRAWLATHPLRDAPTQARLTQAMAAVGF
jgi:TolB-like protein/DNA-binding winged helix-turn-helix (wHTH) protein/Tfp pilus assembly protein PilF